MQRCSVTHEARCKRHNEVCILLQKKLSKKKITCMGEPRIPLSTSFCKPDLIVIHGVKATVIDVQVCGEAQMEESYKGKLQKCGNGGTHEAIRNFLRKTEPGVMQVDHKRLVIYLRGMIYPKSAASLRSLGLKGWDLSDIYVRSIIGSL